jgi:hypothetical protein
MNWTWVFYLLSAVAFVGFFIQSYLRNGHGMVYSAVICAIWILTALWYSGRIVI